MPRTIETQIYKFEELSERAKDRARQWYRDASAHDEWYDSTYEDAVQCAALIGIEVGTKAQNWVNTTTGKRGTHHSPAIFFSGFWSQGDGACFEGSYTFKPDAPAAIRDHAPTDERLHAIADALAALPPGAWSASVKHSGRYYHSGCMDIDVSFDDGTYSDDLALPPAQFEAGEAVIIQAMRDFADWIYRQLEAEHDYLNSDEHVDETIQCNDYEFTEDGAIA